MFIGTVVYTVNKKTGPPTNDAVEKSRDYPRMSDRQRDKTCPTKLNLITQQILVLKLSLYIYI